MRQSPGKLFDGPAGVVAAMIMARSNRPAEAEAVAELAPRADDVVLVIGFGSGVGIDLLSGHIATGRICGVDPSATMLREASRRNRRAIEAGIVELVAAPARALPWEDDRFDGAVAVNSIQLWEPFEASVAEVARTLKPGARLVSITHDWAIARHTPAGVETWAADATSIGAAHGLGDARMWRTGTERNKSVGFAVRKITSTPGREREPS